MNNLNTRARMGMAIAFAMACWIPQAGAQSPALAPAAERELVTGTGSQVWMNGFGECWHSGFGPAPESTRQCDPNYRPPVVAAAPAPYVAPKPVPAPAAPVAALPAASYAKVSMDADTLFAFDKSTLTSEGKLRLDRFSEQLKTVTLTSVVATGHADRFGTESYNQTLSEERALSVKSYLVGQGLAADMVRTLGKGESMPVTKAGECLGAKSAKTIACLQPDRRVEIEALGTRAIK